MSHLVSRSIAISLLQAALLLGAAALLIACGGGDGQDGSDPPEPTGVPLEGDGATEFISHLPGSSSGPAGTGGSTALAADGAASEMSNAAERAISEADIIKIEGNLLYALSSFSGLSVVDISTPSQLRLVGNLRFQADPFEMYLEDDTAYVMFNDYGSYQRDEENQQWLWVTTSRMQAIDVSDPSAMTVLGDRPVFGSISDSRKVGDIIYLVTHQNGYCWRCDLAPTTRVTSFDAQDSSSFQQIDQVAFQSDAESWGGRRSVSVTTDRAYVSGWNWGADAGKGVIDVVDISDPSGQLDKGASIEIAGQIQNRWQMEEEGGILRVISQPGGWGTTTPPVLETFSVTSANEITPLASLDMVLPRPEELRSVRFDGERAYAVTFERTDPLFTFDLSDPAAPKQVGELEIPGWVHHMEPRGDVIYALGFDPQVDGGALHVSLFDVSVLSNPIMLDRVNFGGDWARFAEDQDRIHKAFTILPEEQLILVPFSGNYYDEDDCHYAWESGIQLVDFSSDALTLRGVADQLGSARRSFLQGDVLMGVSEHAVQAFDISNRDEPSELDMLETARNVNFVRKLDKDVVRFGRDWWTDRTILDVTSPERVHEAAPTAELDLTNIAGPSGYSWCDDSDGHVSRSARWSGQVFVHGRHAFVPRYESVHWESDGNYGSRMELSFYIVDLQAEDGPQVVRRLAVDPATSKRNEEGRQSEHFAGIVQTDSALLVGRSSGTFFYDASHLQREQPTFSYDVIDLRDAANAAVVSTIEVPQRWSGGGWSYGVAGCSIDMGWGWWGYGYGYYGSGGNQNALVSGDVVASQHMEPLDDGTDRVRFYLDRMDVSDPTAPVMLDPINIPGQVVHYDDTDQSLVTVDYVLEEWNATGNVSKGNLSCQRGDESGHYSDDGKCQAYYRRLNSLQLKDGLAWRRGMSAIDQAGSQTHGLAVSDSRVFFSRVEGNWDDAAAPQLFSIAVDGRGYMSRLPTLTLEVERRSWWTNLQARDDRVFLVANQELTVVDTSSGRPKPQEVEISGRCQSLEVAGTEAYCAQGQHGVTRFTLD